ncbi:hypothetical protein [Lysinibacillus sp. NPDC093692]|uniref:hypothetical protein n=1 Tax=Lysinibacillus sp. NPDC093692 TaxID=3390578 RepID=UPI003D06D9BE
MVNFLNVKSETNSIDQDLSNVFKKGTLDFFNTTFNMLPPKSWLEINVSFNTRFDMVLEYIEVYVGDGSYANQPYVFEVYSG